MDDRPMPWVVQYCVEVIDAAATFALHGQVGIDRLGPAEQHQHLVQQVRTEVVPQATAGPVLFAPAVAHLRTVTVEVRVALGHVAQAAFGQQRLQGEEVGIETPVLEHGGDAPGIACRSQHRFRFGHIQRERLVDQHMLACRQRRDGQWRVLFVRRGDHYGIHGRIIEYLLRRGTHVHIAERPQQGVAL